MPNTNTITRRAYGEKGKQLSEHVEEVRRGFSADKDDPVLTRTNGLLKKHKELTERIKVGGDDAYLLAWEAWKAFPHHHYLLSEAERLSRNQVEKKKLRNLLVSRRFQSFTQKKAREEKIKFMEDFLLRSAPEYPGIFVHYALLHWGHDWEKTVGALTEAYQKGSSDPRLLTLIAQAFLQLPEERRVLAILPAEALENVAMLYQRQGILGQARDVFQQARGQSTDPQRQKDLEEQVRNIDEYVTEKRKGQQADTIRQLVHEGKFREAAPKIESLNRQYYDGKNASLQAYRDTVDRKLGQIELSSLLGAAQKAYRQEQWPKAYELFTKAAEQFSAELKTPSGQENLVSLVLITSYKGQAGKAQSLESVEKELQKWSAELTFHPVHKLFLAFYSLAIGHVQEGVDLLPDLPLENSSFQDQNLEEVRQEVRQLVGQQAQAVYQNDDWAMASTLLPYAYRIEQVPGEKNRLLSQLLVSCYKRGGATQGIENLGKALQDYNGSRVDDPTVRLLQVFYCIRSERMKEGLNLLRGQEYKTPYADKNLEEIRQMVVQETRMTARVASLLGARHGRNR